MTCHVCDYAAEHGSWPPDHPGTHCSPTLNARGEVTDDGCHRSWTSKSQSHCPVCHRHFGSNAAGDSHRFGDYRNGKTPVCREPVGFDRWETPDGVIWGGRDPKAAKARAAAMRGTARRVPAVSAGATEPASVESSGHGDV